MRFLLLLPVLVGLARGDGYTLFLNKREAFQRSNYFLGQDQIYHSLENQMERGFVVAPGASLDRIELQFSGADQTGILPFDELALQLGKQTLIHEKRNGGRTGFQLGEYDHTLPLVIDPVLIYSTYIGGGSRLVSAISPWRILGRVNLVVHRKMSLLPRCGQSAKAWSSSLTLVARAMKLAEESSLMPAAISGSPGPWLGITYLSARTLISRRSRAIVVPSLRNSIRVEPRCSTLPITVAASVQAPSMAGASSI